MNDPWHLKSVPTFTTNTTEPLGSDIEHLERQAREIKDMGYSSKFLVPINIFLEMARDAKKWREAPAYIRDAASSVRVES